MNSKNWVIVAKSASLYDILNFYREIDDSLSTWKTHGIHQETTDGFLKTLRWAFKSEKVQRIDISPQLRGISHEASFAAL